MEPAVDRTANIALLCDAIVDRYHVSLQEALARIRDEMQSISAVAASPELETLRRAFDDVSEQIASHLAKEEYLLFPAIASLSAAEQAGARRPALAFTTMLHPIRLMESEHARIEGALDRVRLLARLVPESGTPSPDWQRCMADLTKLDTELREHHRTENEVLFPRALELERRVF